MKFTPQELVVIGYFLSQRNKQPSKFAAMTITLADMGKRYPKMELDSELSMGLAIEYRYHQRNSKIPKNKYTLDTECYMYQFNAKVNHASVLHGGRNPEHLDWLNIETECLMCNVIQNAKEHGHSRTTLKQLFIDVAPYFGRTPKSISEHYFRTVRNRKNRK